MASIAQLVSEMAHAVRQPNNKALRENLRLLIIQTRNEIIRRSYENHSYVDKLLTQRFKVTLTSVVDGDFELPEELQDISIPEEYADVDITKIKRTLQKVPRPVRLTNNLPFDRVSSVGFETSREYPYIKETTARFRSYVPGLCGMPCYDYINEYIYIFPAKCRDFSQNAIIIESAFEHPNEISLLNGTLKEEDVWLDENEYLLSEDMIGQIKEIIYKRDLINTVRETDEIPNAIKY